MVCAAVQGTLPVWLNAGTTLGQPVLRHRDPIGVQASAGHVFGTSSCYMQDVDMNNAWSVAHLRRLPVVREVLHKYAESAAAVFTMPCCFALGMLPCCDDACANAGTSSLMTGMICVMYL